MSEPTIPPPSPSDMELDLIALWRHSYAALTDAGWRRVALSLVRRCHAAESQLTAIREFCRPYAGDEECQACWPVGSGEIDTLEKTFPCKCNGTARRNRVDGETPTVELVREFLAAVTNQRDELQKKLDDAMSVLSEWGNIDKAHAISQRNELLAALRQIAADGAEFCMPSRARRESSIDYHRRGDNMRDLARSAIASIEGKS